MCTHTSNNNITKVCAAVSVQPVWLPGTHSLLSAACRSGKERKRHAPLARSAAAYARPSGGGTRRSLAPSMRVTGACGVAHDEAYITHGNIVTRALHVHELATWALRTFGTLRCKWEMSTT